jgi:hypothetical protein
MKRKDSEEVKEVKKQLGMHPISDAKTSLKFVAQQKEIDSAIPRDPQNCALAKVIERISGMNKGIAIFPRSAYVPWDTKGDGNFVIQRYSVRGPAKKAISAV